MRSFRAVGLIVSRKRQESTLLAAGVVGIDGLRDEMASLRLELAAWRAGREPPQA